jgi:hypothetical protein
VSIETVEFSLICREDLDIGSSTRSIELADGSTATLHQVSVASLLIPVTQTVVPSASAATAVLTGLIPAGARVAGVTTEILTTLGTSQGVTGFSIGDGAVIDRWGTQAVLTQGAQTDQGDFLDATWPMYASATHVILSALGGLFDGAGEVEVTAWYFFLTHRSA